MEQAEAKHCERSEQEDHEVHRWVDGVGNIYHCDGLLLSADEVFQRLGIHRVNNLQHQHDTFLLEHLTPRENSLKHLLSERYIDFDSSGEKFIRDIDGDVEVDYAPDSSDGAINFQRKLAEAMDGPIDGMIGVKTEFAQRTYGWTEAQLREALFAKEQEVVELKLLLGKVGEKLQKIASKMLGKVMN